MLKSCDPLRCDLAGAFLALADHVTGAARISLFLALLSEPSGRRFVRYFPPVGFRFLFPALPLDLVVADHGGHFAEPVQLFRRAGLPEAIKLRRWRRGDVSDGR